jgi:2-oxoglutarate ferredoxin oxidoreductase subunit beta
MGDGDSVAIGGNHFIHACRRNIDLTAIIFNNMIYGQTGGQLAPTTLPGRRTTTSVWGNIEPPFDIVSLALGAGAGFVARSTVFDFDELSAILEQALAFKGFSVVEVLTTCPTYFGRYNSNDDPYDMLHGLKERTDPGEEKLPVGIFRNEPRPEYTELYRQLTQKLGGGGQP